MLRGSRSNRFRLQRWNVATITLLTSMMDDAGGFSMMASRPRSLQTVASPSNPACSEAAPEEGMEYAMVDGAISLAEKAAKELDVDAKAKAKANTEQTTVFVSPKDARHDTKSLSRTSYVKRQLRKNANFADGTVVADNRSDDDESTSSASILSAEELMQLANRNLRRTPGSLKATKGWRHWSQLSIDSIRHHLSQRLPHPVDQEAFGSLWFNLGVAADQGTMPCFGDAGSRSGYALDFFCRARLLSDLLMYTTQNPSVPHHWSKGMEQQRLLDGSDGQPTACTLTSLGGGPGYDFVAAALVATFSSSGSGMSALHANVMDYEEGWEDLVVAMSESTQIALQQTNLTASWGGKCDITTPLAHPNNRAMLDKIETTNIWTCQYCVSENAINLRKSNFVFFRELFDVVPEGTLFLFTETTPRLWPDFYKIATTECNYMEIGFPCNQGRSKKARQMSLCKRGQPTEVAQADLDCLEEFRQFAKCHREKLESGIIRQTKKVRGGK